MSLRIKSFILVCCFIGLGVHNTGLTSITTAEVINYFQVGPGKVIKMGELQAWASHNQRLTAITQYEKSTEFESADQHDKLSRLTNPTLVGRSRLAESNVKTTISCNSQNRVLVNTLIYGAKRDDFTNANNYFDLLDRSALQIIGKLRVNDKLQDAYFSLNTAPDGVEVSLREKESHPIGDGIIFDSHIISFKNGRSEYIVDLYTNEFGGALIKETHKMCTDLYGSKLACTRNSALKKMNHVMNLGLSFSYKGEDHYINIDARDPVITNFLDACKWRRLN